jgi:cytochrome c5
MSSKITPHRITGAWTRITALALLVLLGAGCSDQGTSQTEEAATEEAPAEQMATPEAVPAEPEAAAEEAATETMAVAEEAAAADGKQIYDTNCQACHNAGVAGAPKLGDKEAWAARIAKGNDAMLSSVVNGLNAMPPKGACMSCSDDDLSAAVAYMVEQGS